MRIPIYGATGIVGRQDRRLLSAAGHEVIALTGHATWHDGFAGERSIRE